MRKPATADERERRMIEYLSSAHQGRIAEFRLTRLNRIANWRKKLKELLDEIIEERAEELAAAMLMQYAPPRPESKRRTDPETTDVTEGRLPIPPKKAMPVWVRKAASGRQQ